MYVCMYVGKDRRKLGGLFFTYAGTLLVFNVAIHLYGIKEVKEEGRRVQEHRLGGNYFFLPLCRIDQDELGEPMDLGLE